MAGFLNRLAARALGEVPLAEPLTPARFTPGNDPREGTASVSERETVSPHASRNHEHESLQNTREFAKDPEIRRPEERSDRQRSEVRFTSVLPSPVLSVEEVSHRELPEDTSQVSRTALQFPLPVTSETRDPLNTSMRASEERVPTPMSAVPLTPAPFAEAAPVRREERRVPEHLPAQRPPLHPEPSSATPPVVRVTIGRIDVRAELANAPAAPVARPRTPTVSLDQFLKQRSAGKR